MIEQPVQQDLTGRILALNLQVCKRFQVGGFAISQNHPFDVVTSKARNSMPALWEAIYQGKLIDVTDQSKEGLKGKYASHTSVTAEEGGRKVYLQTGQDGSLVVVIPRDEAHEKQCEAEIAERGVLAVDEYQISEVPFALPRVDQTKAEELIHQMAEVISKARSDQ